jgi:hypothetical protein
MCLTPAGFAFHEYCWLPESERFGGFIARIGRILECIKRDRFHRRGQQNSLKLAA